MRFNHLELVCFSENQKQYFLSLSEENKPDFIKKHPALIDCSFIFLGESPSMSGYGFFIPTDTSSALSIPHVFSCDVSCFVCLTKAKPIKTKKDSYKDALLLLSEQITLVIDALDTHFAQNHNIPEKESKNLAKISNALDFANDRVRHRLGLPIDAENKEKHLALLKTLLADM